MQTDPDSLRKGGVDADKKINFRPSPNFCNMKRFLKKKIVDTCTNIENAGGFTPDAQHEPSPIANSNYIQRNIQHDQTPNATSTYIPRNIQHDQNPNASSTYIPRNIQYEQTQSASYYPRNIQHDQTPKVTSTYIPRNIHYDQTPSTSTYIPSKIHEQTPKATSTYIPRNNQHDQTSGTSTYTSLNIQEQTPKATSTYIPMSSSQIENKKEEKPKIQPPLPLYPPPPDTPPDLVTIKQEVEDYTTTEDDASIKVSQFTTQTTTPDKPKKAICKDFIRGNCLRTQCKFAHELDLTQLEGIYTFCWNFQNSGCQIPNCRYVHASPFEEGEFYRTGVLPPHALNHVKQQSQAPAPPAPTPTAAPMPTINMLPPPPPPPPEEPPIDMNVLFSNPPPPLYTAMPLNKPPPPVMMMQPPPPMMSELEALRMQMMRPSTSKTTWRPMEDRLGFPGVSNQLMDCLEQAPECSSCPEMEFRLQYNKAKVEKQKRTNKELEDKNALLDIKINKLYAVLLTLLKPNSQPNVSAVPSMSTTDIEKVEDRLMVVLNDDVTRLVLIKTESNGGSELTNHSIGFCLFHFSIGFCSILALYLEHLTEMLNADQGNR